MKATIKNYTNFSNSPVFEIKNQWGSLRVALTHDGNIYRLIGFNEPLKEGEEIEIELTEFSEKIIRDWEQKNHYASRRCGCND